MNVAAPDSWAEELLSIVRSRFGHDVPERRREALRRAAVEAYLASEEPSLGAYVLKVATAPLESPCVAELVKRITVKESYFFRDEVTHATLGEILLPRLIARAASSNELSFWSAGASNGEEPYTLAILLDALWQGAPDVRVRIVGTDLDDAALRVARNGEYGEWSVRTLPETLRARYFDRRGERFVLRDRYRRWVRFEIHNLADPESAAPEPGQFDLVLCRNVAIYLTDAGILAAFSKIARALKPGGVLVTAPSDPRPDPSCGLEPLLIKRGQHATVVYAPGISPFREERFETPGVARRTSEQPPSAAPIPHSPSVPQQIDSIPSLPIPNCLESNREQEPVIGAREPFAASVAGYPTRDLARQAIERAPLDAPAHFALALFEIERDAYDAAEAALKKVLYLVPHLPEAHYRFGLLRMRLGDTEGARRAFWNAMDAVAAGRDDTPSWVASLGACLAELERRR